MTCVQALFQQDAEMDRDIARVLQRVVGDKLDITTELIEALALDLDLREVEA